MQRNARTLGPRRSRGMTRAARAAALCIAVALTAAAAHGQEVVARFSGSGPGNTEVFSVDGPWLLNWRVGSEFPTLAHVELHLYDARTGKLAGVALRRPGTGSGQRLIREGGEYRIVVVGTGIDWSLEIEEAPGTIAELLRENPDLETVDLVSPDIGLSRDIVSQIRSWRTDDGRTLTLETDDGRTLSVDFYGGGVCPGLADAENVFFVTSSLRGTLFNGILLENGTRCYFGGAARID